MPINPPFDNTIRFQTPWGLLLIAIGLECGALSPARRPTFPIRAVLSSNRAHHFHLSPVHHFTFLTSFTFHLFNPSTQAAGLVRSSNAFRSALSRRYSSRSAGLLKIHLSFSSSNPRR